MSKTKNKEVLVSTELAEGLAEVLESALSKGQLRGCEKQLAAAYAEMLAGRLASNENSTHIQVSIELIANILRIILMILVPDPLIRGLVAFLGGMR